MRYFVPNKTFVDQTTSMSATLIIPLLLIGTLTGCDHGVIQVDSNLLPDTESTTTSSSSSITETTTTSPVTTPTITNTTATDPTGTISDTVAWIGSMPTVIHVDWLISEPAEAWVEYRKIDSKEWMRTPTHQITDTGSSSILGVPEMTEIEFKVVAVFSEGEVSTSVATITTGAFSADIPRPTILGFDQDLAHQSAFIMGSVSSSSFYWFIYICDRNGNLVWLHELPYYHWGLYVRPSVNNNTLLFNDSPAWGFGSDVATVVEVSLDSAIWETHETPDQNHAFASVTNGLVWPEMDGNVENLVQRIDNASVEEIWNAQSWFNEVNTTAKNASNALFWNEPEDSLLFSWYNRHGVIEVDRGSGEVLRVFGQLPDAYSFDPPDSRFSFQHHPTYTDEGNLLLTSTPYPPGPNDETVAREYEVDDDARVLKQVWSYGEGTGMQAEQIGEATRLDNGNTIINYGTDPRIREVTTEGDIAWEAKWYSADWMGSTVTIVDLYDFCPAC